jgi:hypothetical protein
MSMTARPGTIPVAKTLHSDWLAARKVRLLRSLANTTDPIVLPIRELLQSAKRTAVIAQVNRTSHVALRPDRRRRWFS